MAKTGRPKAELVLSDDERGQLERWARRAKSSQALALRCRIVLACADGLDNKQVADKLGCHQVTVGKWRSRFVAARLAGLHDEDRAGAPDIDRRRAGRGRRDRDAGDHAGERDALDQVEDG
jgi:hypothetical protein